MKRVVVVSPHRDDAAFSCGIAIRSLAQHHVVTVANFFTVSRYAPFANNARVDVSHLRFLEDLAFAKLTGVALSDLQLIDAPERLAIGVAQIASVRSFDARDDDPLRLVREHVASLSPDLIFLPLALGDHIDHRLAQSAAIAAGCSALAFYEDLPYAARLAENAPAERARKLAMSLSPRIIRANGAEKWKKQCARCYPSQVESGTVGEIASFGLRYAGGERYWTTPSAAEFLDGL